MPLNFLFRQPVDVKVEVVSQALAITITDTGPHNGTGKDLVFELFLQK